METSEEYFFYTLESFINSLMSFYKENKIIEQLVAFLSSFPREQIENADLHKPI